MSLPRELSSDFLSVNDESWCILGSILCDYHESQKRKTEKGVSFCVREVLHRKLRNSVIIHCALIFTVTFQRDNLKRFKSQQLRYKRFIIESN